MPGELLFNDGFEDIPVKLRPGMTVFEAVRAIAALPMDAQFAGFEPAELDPVRVLGQGAIHLDTNQGILNFPLEVPPRTEALTQMEKKMLVELTSHPGKLVEYPELMSPATQCYSLLALSTHMNNIRKKLGSAPAKIENVRAKGYLFRLLENSDLSTEM